MKVPSSSPQPNNKPTSCTTTTGGAPAPAAARNNTSFHTNTNTTTPPPPAINLCYEPTSVLDIRRSPSPTSTKPAAPPISNTGGTDTIEWDEHVLQALDWDSIMRELDVHVVDNDSGCTPPLLLKNFPQFISTTDSNQIFPHHNDFPPSNTNNYHITNNQLVLHSDFNDNNNYMINSNNISLIQNQNNIDHHQFSSHHSSNSNNFDLIIQELIKAADCFDSDQLQLAQSILDWLNNRLPSPTGKPLQRAAFFFKEALHSLLTTGSARPPPSSDHNNLIIQTIKAYKAFFTISPIPMFTDFTTNQALLDSLLLHHHHDLDGEDSNPSPLPFIHVIDFDIGFGCQYASLMRELVDKSEHSNNSFRKMIGCTIPPLLRITAVVQEDLAVEIKLIKERLFQFAQELKIRFRIDFVLMRNFEALSFKSVNFVEGEKTAVLLSPLIFRRLSGCNSGNNNNINVSGFLNDLRRVSPNVVVFVDNETWLGECGTASFRRNFVNCLEFYSVMFESLDAAVGGAAGGDLVRRQIEMFLLKPRILAAVEAGCGRRAGAGAVQAWREVLSGAGMRAVQLSQFADFQAEFLLGKVQVRGFYVAKRQAELVLCWHDRPLIATSAWKF